MDDPQDPDDRLAALRRETFVPRVGRHFTFSADGLDAFEAELLEARDESLPDGRHGPAGARPAFSLVFRPVDGAPRAQRTYTIAADGFTPVAVFCVPGLGHDGGPVLQATFN